jgi:hypothetical protein
MNTETILGCLIAVAALSSCGPSPAYDWKGYSLNMPLVQPARGSNRAYSNTGSKTPAIFGIGGWEGGNHMERVVGPLSSEVKFSDSRTIAFGQWPDVMEAIKDQHLNGHPIILIGYSAGCSDALKISNILDNAHVPVGLILMDATYLGSGMFKPTLNGIQNVDMIPGNVYMVENYVTHSPFGGRYLTTRDLKNPENTKFRNTLIRCIHLNLLLKKYSDQYAASVRAIMDEYSRRY